MRRPTKVVPRMIFDARLVSAAVAAGAVLRRHTVRKVDHKADLVVLDGAIAARAVVGADGVNGVVRGSLGLAPNPPSAMAVALRAYAATPVGHEDEQYMIMSGTGWPAYAWSFPIGDGSANVGYGMVLQNGTASRSELEHEMHRLLPGLGEVREARAHRLPLSTVRPRQPDGRVVLAGDAASLINPFTGEGIYYAVRSGALAGIAALRGAEAGRIVRTVLQRRLGAHLRGTSLIAWLGQSPAVVDAGIRAAAGDQLIFDDLVEVGLAEGRLTGRALVETACQIHRSETSIPPRR
jgi:flavin-dependent dehydrogenase